MGIYKFIFLILTLCFYSLQILTAESVSVRNFRANISHFLIFNFYSRVIRKFPSCCINHACSSAWLSNIAFVFPLLLAFLSASSWKIGRRRKGKCKILEVRFRIGRFSQGYYGLLWNSEKRLRRASSDFCRRFYPGSRRPWFTNAPAKSTKDGGGAVVKDEILPPRCGANKIETRSASSNAKQPAGRLASQSREPTCREHTLYVRVSVLFLRTCPLEHLPRLILFSHPPSVTHCSPFEISYLVSLVASVRAGWNSFHLSPFYRSLQWNGKKGGGESYRDRYILMIE